MFSNRVLRASLIALLSFFAVALSLAAAQRADVGADARSHWQSLAARSPQPVFVSWNARGSAADTIFGVFSGPTVAVSANDAIRFIKEHSALFMTTGDAEHLVLARDTTSPGGRHIVFQQFYRGVRVHGSQIAVHYNSKGEIVGANNSILSGIALDSVEPLVSPDRALDSLYLGDEALSREIPRYGRGESERSSELVIVDFDGTPQLAWRTITITVDHTWESFVDAQTGRLLGKPRDINRYVNGSGQVFIVNAVVATRNNALADQNDAASAVPESAYASVTLQNLAGNGFLDGAYASSARSKQRASSATNSFFFDRSNDGFSEVMGYYYLDYAQRYIQSLGFANVNNRQQAFSINRYKKDNSFYSPGSQDITLGLGGVDDAEDADVIVHEYGHSIQDNQVPGFGSTLEAGSMGEGFGDYLAGTIGAQLSGGFQDTCLAEWDAVSYSSTNPPCLRRLDGTKHYPESVVGEVHDDGEIWSAALWEIRGAIGAPKADKVILQHHFIIPANASFNQAANALVTSAINLDYGPKVVNSIRTILRARGFTVTV